MLRYSSSEAQVHCTTGPLCYVIHRQRHRSIALRVRYATVFIVRQCQTYESLAGPWRSHNCHRSCARPTPDGWPLMWVNRPLQVSQLGQLSFSSFRGRYMSSELQVDVVTTVRGGGAIWWTRTKAKGRHGVVCRLNCVTMSERIEDEMLVI